MADVTITEKFTKLSDKLGKEVWITIKDPDFLADADIARRDVAKNDDGTENDDDRMLAFYEVLASLVVDGQLYDKTNTEILIPLTADDIRARLPRSIRQFLNGALLDPQ